MSRTNLPYTIAQILADKITITTFSLAPVKYIRLISLLLWGILYGQVRMLFLSLYIGYVICILINADAHINSEHVKHWTN